MTPTKVGNVLSWGSDVEEATIEQAAKASRLPFVAGHLALMPDAHVGVGSTIGSVIPTKGAIIPSAIGVDIGCGMIAVETSLNADRLPDDMDGMLSRIASVVPAGVGQGHAGESDWDWDRRTRKVPSFNGATDLTSKQVTTLNNQFGTLGSGNHFVEVCLDKEDRVWLMLHSGSRGVGNAIGSHYIAAAKKRAGELSG